MECRVIAALNGKVMSVHPCVIAVGGVGFELQVPEKDAVNLTRGDDVSFHTYLYVREDRLTLFGFLTKIDRELFTRLIEVSGIGPKIAVKMLGEYETGRIIHAVRTGDIAFLTRLPGLGKKTAERLTIELKDKLEGLAMPSATPLPGVAGSLREEAILALTTLGMQRTVAEKALDVVDWASKTDADLADIVKDALKHASNV
jgi:Holliday junction DNA helicase RuvA